MLRLPFFLLVLVLVPVPVLVLLLLRVVVVLWSPLPGLLLVFLLWLRTWSCRAPCARA